ncbi:type III pantothenate kinase [Aquirufa ecclesiirivi]|uniref:type III pantothenate kinase n=1 Tax=Aquirufa ecclesiirivi TaxID=2715124 RepID=UPI0014084D1B|nr:type III pantothenate kinase [Aquirufa ecclesiirivi]MDF0694085.1 type III pantothenate kinase [Aquirufa ecclesiirivi]NHC50096.1 type III pantothenate kinase [Aquirufa ecclesiirivi]
MLLVVDIGNTDIVFGFYTEGDWKLILRTPTHQPWTTLRMENWIRQEWLEKNIGSLKPQKLIISSVVPAVSYHVQKGLENWLSISADIMSPKLYKKFPIDIISPDEIGSDLVANAVYAHHAYQADVLIVDFGTALTFTLVNAQGKMEGVSIAPGLKTAVKSLFSQTAQLPEVPLEMPHSALGFDTVSAIQSGILWGYVGMVKEMIHRVKDEKGQHVKVLATGGLSSILTPLESYFDEVNKLITLEGLRLISENYID